MKAILSLATTILVMNAQAVTSGAGSFEFMCKAKAKEIAAETYSGCINDNKQAELERIRKEYQAELAKVKAKYNNELKGLGGGASGATSTATQKKGAATAPKATSNTAASMTDMPAKKLKTSRVRTEKIDFSSDGKEESQPETNPNLGSDANEGATTLSSTEIVELPAQEE